MISTADYSERPDRISCPACGHRFGRVKPGRNKRCGCGNKLTWEDGEPIWDFYVAPEPDLEGDPEYGV